MEIDYAVAWRFVDAGGRRLQLRFRPNATSPDDPGKFDCLGQLVAVSDSCYSDYDELAISRPNVLQADVDAAIVGWEDWATLLKHGVSRWISLTDIQRRIDAAGLGLTDSSLADRCRDCARPYLISGMESTTSPHAVSRRGGR
ncbi:hypothetical protein MSIMFI_05099 [Mycobacterium simulans]|uniref:hypothetical protein n=1 Tax=Mycobacterium simulans TaxID=627089 RepID=UPI00174C8BF6|nr:hypothetical protein [Mycobacterium simulans]SON63568.1 hypothetical protein MSIMFI_05099 [Mycobacterium simulans]